MQLINRINRVERGCIPSGNSETFAQCYGILSGSPETFAQHYGILSGSPEAFAQHYGKLSGNGNNTKPLRLRLVPFNKRGQQGKTFARY